MSKFHTLIAFFTLIFSFHASAQQIVEGLAAVVNGEPILFSEVRYFAEPKESEIKGSSLPQEEMVSAIKAYRLEALDKLIEERLMFQEAQRRGYKLPPGRIQKRIDEIVRDQYQGDMKHLIREMNMYGRTLGDFRREIERQILIQGTWYELCNEAGLEERKSSLTEEEYNAERLRIGREFVAMRRAEATIQMF